MEQLSKRRGAADSLRIPSSPEAHISIYDGRLSIMSADKTLGAARRVIAQAIHQDITDFCNSSLWGTSPEELARVWAEALVEESGGSYRLFEALGEYLRDLSAEGQEWASGALAAMEGRAAA